MTVSGRKPHFLFFLMIGLLFWSCEQLTGVRTLKIAHGHAITHPIAPTMDFLAKRAKEISNGALQIEVYPGQQLGTERQCLELLQIGSLAMTKVSAAVFENFAPNSKVLSLPYIFRSREHQYRVFESEIGKSLLTESEKYWLRGLCFYDAGSRSFYTKDRPINKPEDLQGLKIRVQESATAMSLVRNLGGAPTPISYGELYTALQQGIVDGAENNPPSFFTERHYETCKYYAINEHTTVPDIFLISTIIWDRLSEEEKKWLEQAVAESVVFERAAWKKAEQEALEAVQKAGVQITYPDKAPFMERLEGMLEAYQSEPEVYQLIQQIRAIE